LKECSKSIARRLHDPAFIRHYFRGSGIDIGGAPDPLALYRELFPLIEEIRTWDLADGDAQEMAGVPDGKLDFVHSSHCLEHLRDPAAGLRNWLRILKPGGHMIVTVPDEDLYEQGIFPSTFNADHKWTFTIHKAHSWSSRSLNLLDLLGELGPEVDIRRLIVIDATYRYELPRYDQTLTPIAESAIEFAIRKRAAAEVSAGGRVRTTASLPEEALTHYNQYRDDRAVLRNANKDQPPFQNRKKL
jgi:SAM-dependent methyltransferase